MEDIVIVSAARTAVGKFGGSLAKTPAPEMGAAVIAEVLKRSGLTGEQIGEAIMGQVLAAGSGQNPARQSVIKSGLPKEVPGSWWTEWSGWLKSHAGKMIAAPKGYGKAKSPYKLIEPAPGRYVKAKATTE